MEEKEVEVVLSTPDEKWNSSGKSAKSIKYDWLDKIAKKYWMTELQYEFVQNYLKTWNATQSVRAARGWEVKPSDAVHWHHLKNNTRVMKYIQETAMKCAEIQMDQIILNKKAPMAVRNDAIKDRLNRAWIGKDDEEKPNMYIWQMTITVDK